MLMFIALQLPVTKPVRPRNIRAFWEIRTFQNLAEMFCLMFTLCKFRRWKEGMELANSNV
jgi:hypothetical protein